MLWLIKDCHAKDDDDETGFIWLRVRSISGSGNELSVLSNTGSLLTSGATTSFSRTPLHGVRLLLIPPWAYDRKKFTHIVVIKSIIMCH
jgi:hypothetical protein